MSAPLPVKMADVKARLPHDPGGFVQGLFYHQGKFIESTGGYGRSSLRRVEPDTGEILLQRSLPAHVFGEGCAPTGDGRIVQLTWRNRIAYIYDAESFRILDTVPYPREGWGLIFDGNSLVASDGSHRLYWLHPETLATRRRIEVRTRDGRHVTRLNEMAWVEGRILANVFPTNLIVCINPDSGLVERSWDLTDIVRQENPRHPEHVLNGIAYDPDSGRLWITGKCWRWIYQVELPELNDWPD